MIPTLSLAPLANSPPKRSTTVPSWGWTFGRLVGLGLTPGEARTLIHFHRVGAPRQIELAQQMAIEPMTLVGFLDRLEAGGLVTRAPAPGDRRAKIVRLTDAAGPVLASVLDIARRARASSLAGMSEAEAEQFLHLLERVHGNLAGCRAENAA